jgi:hypothetical protein
MRACACRDVGHIASAIVRGTHRDVAAIAGRARRTFHTTVVTACSDCGGADFSKGFEA